MLSHGHVLAVLTLGLITCVSAVPYSRISPQAAALQYNCTCIDSAQDKDVQAPLSWVCGEGGVDCGPIGPGGAHFEPNTAVDHADYAFNQFWEAHSQDGYGSCFFGGVARLSPAPAGHFFLTHNAELMYPWPSTPHNYIGQWDTIQEGHERSYDSGVFGGTYNGNPTIFRLWVASGYSGASFVRVSVHYHLPCKGSTGLSKYRTEWYDQMTVKTVPAYQAYTNAVPAVQTQGDFCDVEAGAFVNVTVQAVKGGGDVQVMLSTRDEPSFITAPFS